MTASVVTKDVLALGLGRLLMRRGRIFILGDFRAQPRQGETFVSFELARIHPDLQIERMRHALV